MKTSRARLLLTGWLGVAGGCASDGSPGAADGTGTTDADTETGSDTDTDTDPTATPECVGEGSMEPFGTSGNPDPGDGACGEHELCVIDECVPIPFEPVDGCEPAVSPTVETVAFPVALGGIVGADLDNDGTDEIWGYDGEGFSIRGFDRAGNELGAVEVDADGGGIATTLRWEAAPDSLLAVVRAPVGDGTGDFFLHTWQGEAGLELAEPRALADEYVFQVLANDFDGDGSIEIIVDYGYETLELWTVVPESAPVRVETRVGSYTVVVLPLPDGSGLGLAMRGTAETLGELFYYAVTSDGLEHVATRAIADGAPLAFGPFRNASTIELFVAGGEGFSEFDSASAYGLGTVDETAVHAPALYFFSLLDSAEPALVADLDARPVAMLYRDDGEVLVRFDADGTPCTTAVEIGYPATVGDFDGDGRTDVLSPTDDGAMIFSSP